jgi:hypothetical protein
MLDKTKSYKIVGGKFVERTPEEVALLEQRKAAQIAREPAQQQAPRVKGHFVMVSPVQIAKVHELGSAACWSLFMVLLLEDYRQRGQPFVLSIDKATSMLGLSEANLRRALGRLEGCGLISTIRNPPKPPLIKVYSLMGERMARQKNGLLAHR